MTLSDGVMALAETDGSVLVLRRQNELVVIDQATGAARAIVPLAGLNLFVPNTKTPVVYAGSDNGLLCCLSPPGARPTLPGKTTEKGDSP